MDDDSGVTSGRSRWYDETASCGGVNWRYDVSKGPEDGSGDGQDVQEVIMFADGPKF